MSIYYTHFADGYASHMKLIFDKLFTKSDCCFCRLRWGKKKALRVSLLRHSETFSVKLFVAKKQTNRPPKKQQQKNPPIFRNAQRMTVSFQMEIQLQDLLFDRLMQLLPVRVCAVIKWIHFYVRMFPFFQAWYSGAEY